MKVLLCVASFKLDYGGPALSVSRLGAELLESKFVEMVGLWAPDGSAMTSPLVDAIQLKSAGAGFVRCPGSLDQTKSMLGKPDIIHDNGIWLPYNRAVRDYARKADIPRVVSTRGMLEPWALNYKKLKKKVAWRVYQKRDLQSAALLHATATEEAKNLRELGLKSPIVVAPNGVDVPKIGSQSPRSNGLRTMLFMSRVHPKKGLPILVEAISELRPVGWRVVVAGPDELGHAEHIRLLAKRMGVLDWFEFVGPQYGSAKNKLFSEADLFVLPTYSENFGIVIAEALAHQIPVLTTKATPWNSLKERDCGWWVDANKSAFTAALAEAVAICPDRRKEMGNRGRALVQETLGWAKIAETISTAYSELTC